MVSKATVGTLSGYSATVVPFVTVGVIAVRVRSTVANNQDQHEMGRVRLFRAPLELQENLLYHSNPHRYKPARQSIDLRLLAI